MRKNLWWLALLGFVVSVLVHGCAVVGVDVASAVPAVFVLHILMFVVFIPFVLAFNKRFGRRARVSDLTSLLPQWVAVTIFVLFAYVLLNFFLFMVATEGGSPVLKESGEYVLQARGKLLRVLTAQEYHAFKANEVRGFSGHWLLFYFVPFAYFFFVERKERKAKTQAQA